MNHESNQDERIDLGVASIETRGGQIGFEDTEDTLKVSAGLTDD